MSEAIKQEQAKEGIVVGLTLKILQTKIENHGELLSYVKREWGTNLKV